MKEAISGGGILRIVIYPQENHYVAQCLEYDFATQGKTMAEIEASLARVIAAYVDMAIESGRQPFEGLRRGPQEAWNRFQNAGGADKILRVRLERVPAPAYEPESVAIPECAVLQVA